MDSSKIIERMHKVCSNCDRSFVRNYHGEAVLYCAWHTMVVDMEDACCTDYIRKKQ